MSKRIFILSAIFFLWNPLINAQCVQDSYGGQCVAYARAYFGNDRTKMPPLSTVSRDLGAYNAYGFWDLGYGYGSIPQSQSIFVQARSRYSPLGHMGVVVHSTRLDDGRFELIVNDSNWGNDERVDCGRRLIYDPVTRQAVRDQGAPRLILGFIYSGNSQYTSEPGARQPGFFDGIENTSRPLQPTRYLTDTVSRSPFAGLDRSTLGMDRLPVFYRSAKGYVLDAATRAKVQGLRTYHQLKHRGQEGYELISSRSKSTAKKLKTRSLEMGGRLLETAKRKFQK